MVFLASDHGGFDLKKEIISLLAERGITYKDFGPYKKVMDDDYPDYVIPAMLQLQKEPQTKAILFCRNGVGVSMLANKFKGVKCALSWTPEHAKSSRTDDDTNALALPADYVTIENAKDIVMSWLSTDFSNEERHIRRLNKFKDLP